MTVPARSLPFVLPLLVSAVLAVFLAPPVRADDPVVSAQNRLSALELEYLGAARDTTEAGYRLQAKVLERIADLNTASARKKLEGFLAGNAGRYPRKAILILRALVRNGSPKDVDEAIRWIEQQRDPALVMMLHEVISAPTRASTREHLLRDVLHSVSMRVQVQVVRGLGYLGDDKAIGPLLKVLRRSHSDGQMKSVGVEAMEALGRLQAKNALPLLQVFLRSPAFELRDAAARALGLLGQAQAVPALRRSLADDDALVVESAAIALGRIGSPRAIPDLIAGLEKYMQRNLRLVDAFASALQHISGKAIAADAELWRAWWETVKDKPWMKAEEPLGGVTVEGPSYHGTPVRSSRVVFVIDVSRSMGWNKRLQVAKKEIAAVLRRLPRATRFGLIKYSDRAVMWKGPDLKPATPSRVRSALDYVNGLQPDNGTNTHAALMKAFDAPRADTIFLLSDGHPSVTPGEDPSLADPKYILNHVRERNRYRRVRINTIYMRLGAPPRSMRSLEDPAKMLSFMQALAEQNGGNFKQIE